MKVNWITIFKGGDRKRHIKAIHYVRYITTICDEDIEEMFILDKDDSTAPKCENCIGVLRRLIEE